MPDELLTNSAGTAVGVVFAAIIGAAIGIKKLLGMVKLSDNSIRATVDGTQRLLDLLDAERKDKAVLQSLLDESNKRADRANEERNQVIRELGEIRAQLATLELEVRMLRKSNNDKQA